MRNLDIDLQHGKIDADSGISVSLQPGGIMGGLAVNMGDGSISANASAVGVTAERDSTMRQMSVTGANSVNTRGTIGGTCSSNATCQDVTINGENKGKTFSWSP